MPGHKLQASTICVVFVIIIIIISACVAPAGSEEEYNEHFV